MNGIKWISVKTPQEMKLYLVLLSGYTIQWSRWWGVGWGMSGKEKLYFQEYEIEGGNMRLKGIMWDLGQHVQKLLEMWFFDKGGKLEPSCWFIVSSFIRVGRRGNCTVRKKVTVKLWSDFDKTRKILLTVAQGS